MKKFMKKCKRALVVAMTIALVGNSMDWSMLNVRAEKQPGIEMEVGEMLDGSANIKKNTDGEQNGATVSDNDAQTVSGADGSVSGGDFEIQYYEEVMEMPLMETTAMTMSFFSLRNGTVELVASKETEWINRLDLTDASFATDFYAKLVEASDNDGTNDWLIEDSYFASTYDKEEEILPQIQLVQFSTTGATWDEALAVAKTEAEKYSPYLQAVTNAFDRDHPEVFWLSGMTMYNEAYSGTGSINGWTCNATISLLLRNSAGTYDMRATGYQSQSAIEVAIADRDAYVSTITGAVSGKSVVEKIEYFNEVLTKSNEYNTSADLNNIGHDCRECVSALAGKTGTEGPVCEGYARAFKVLCDEVGIPCVLVDGYAKNSTTSIGEAHMWNYVQVDGNWYAVDVTWNDPVMLNGSGGAVSGGEDEEWLLVGSDTVVSGMTFITSHPVSNTVSDGGVAFTNGPVLSTTEYTEPVTTVAEVTTGVGVTTPYEDIKLALDAAGESAGATLKLVKNAELAQAYSVGGDFTLDLNGCTLDLGTYTMVVPEGATLTIRDSSASGTSIGTGKLTSCVKGVEVIDNNGTLKVLSGTIEATEAAEYTTNYAICNRNIMEMSGGLVTNNAWHGRGIYNTDSGQLTVTGGVVQGSTHTETWSAVAEGISNMGALTIMGTPGIYGGGDSAGISHHNGSFKLSGAPSIQGSVEFGDIELASVALMTITDALTGSDSYSVYSDGGLGVFAVPGTGYTISDSDQAKFTSAIGFDISKNGEGKLVFSHVHEDVSFDKVWDIYSGDVATGNYVLGSDIWGANVVNITGDVTLCLNGSLLEGDLTIAEGASLTICDCSTDGTGRIEGSISNSGSLTLKGGTIDALGTFNGVFADYGAIFTMTGGTIQNAVYGVDVQEKAIFTMTDGTIQDCTTSGVLNDGTFIMNGGTIQDCTTNGVTGGLNTGGVMTMSGGTIQNCGLAGVSGIGSLTLTGGSISGKQGIRMGDAFCLSGKPVIDGTEVDILLFENKSTISVAGALTGIDSYSVKIVELNAQDTTDLPGVFATGGIDVNTASLVIYQITASDAERFITANTNMLIERDVESNQLLLDYKKGDIPISITWEDEGNKYGTRPTSIKVDVYANDVCVESVDVTEEDSWKYTLEDMYLYDANGAITYDVKLYDPNGVYNGAPGASEDGFVIIASLNHVHELYLSQSHNGVANTQYVEILCEGSDSEDCDWSAGDYRVTISGPDNSIYDGNVKTATTVDYITGYTNLATVSDITYYAKKDNQWTAVTEAVEVGIYKAEVTVTMGSDTMAAWVEFEVTQLDAASYVDVVPYDGAYDPFAVDGVEAVRIHILHPEMDATIEYSTDGGNTWSANVPVMSNVGSLEVMVKVTAPNFTEYTETVTAVMRPFDISTCGVELEQDSYYYTGQQIKPVVTGILESLGRMPLTEADYKITYGDNNSAEMPGYVSVEAMNPNYTGMVLRDFNINYYDGTVEVLYNGAEKSHDYYNADVAISAEGYTVSKNIDGPYTDSVMLSGEGSWVEMSVYFKQDGTGYITSAKYVSAMIDKTKPTFEGQDLGILVGDYDWWNSLAEKITYDVYYKEAQKGFIVADDTLSGVNPLEIYYYIDRSGSETVKTAEELDACDFVPIETEEDTGAAGGSVEGGSGAVADSGSSSSGDGAGGDFRIEEDGKYVIYAYVVDRAGNKSDYICTNGIVLDTKEPVVEASVPSEAEGTLTDTGVTFTVEADEDAIALLQVLYNYSGEEREWTVVTDMPEEAFEAYEGIEFDKQFEQNDTDMKMMAIGYKVALTAGEAKTFTITGLLPNTEYEYAMIVYDEAHNVAVVGNATDVEGEYGNLQFTTLKTIPTFAENPTITGTYGDELSRMTLSQPASTNGIPGTWSIVYAGAGQRRDMPAVNGTTAYTVKFTPKDTDTYETVIVQVVPTVEKRPLTVTVDNQTRKYGEENPELTYTITEGSIVDGDYAGRPRLSIALSTTATKTSDVGAYDITGTVTNDVNYDVTVQKGTLTIEKADAVITVEASKEAYSKTFGDDSFTLSGISTNSDGKLSYSVANSDVVSVDANGKVTINGAGSAVITVSVAATGNYKAAEAVEITVDVAKATVADATVSKSYLYLKDAQESIDLAGYVPADAGTVAYQIGAISGACEFAVAPAVANGKLSYTVKAGEAGENASFMVTVSSDNYKSFAIKVTVTLVDQTPVVEKVGSEVSLKNNTLTYGEALSKLEFNEAVFVAEGTDEVVTGKLTWETPELTPDVTTTKATWVFTPDSNEYMEATGEVAIVVKKATQPAFSIVAIGEVEYAPDKELAVTTTGGITGGKVTVSAPANNGVVEVNADGTAKVLGAGSVTITAVKVDAVGNYEDATATYELTVAPASLKAEQVAWATGFNGEKTYTGQVQEADVVVTVAGVTLVEGTDYTVAYVNNTDAYTLTESEADFDADKAPVVVVTGKGNYAGTVKKYFVINKADAVITVEAGKDAYSKTFGDGTFVLSGISTNSDGKLSYTVANSDVVSVDANGKITINGAGSAVITVSVAATDNYKAAEAVEITVNVAKATVADATVSKSYLYLKDAQESMDLTGYVPADAGTVSYSVSAVSGACEFAVVPVVTNGKLSYTVKAGDLGDSASFAVTVSSDNYEAFDIQVTVTLVNQTPVEAKKVSLKNTLTYGDALSKLEFAEAVFVVEGTDEVVIGTIAWETPDFQPNVATIKATWVFTPDDAQYMTVTGEVAIVVEKAEYPEMTIVQVKPTVYGENGYLAVEGAFDTSEVTMTVPENNGVVKEIKQVNGSFEIVAENAGTVTITATAKDTTGNYKDGTATYELTVAPAEMKLEWLGWAEGFDGEATYTGDALIPNVVVQNGAVTLVQGQDYTVEYNNNEFTYTLKEGDEGFDAAKAPKAVIIGKGNYEGEAMLCFVINKAENAPNMPKSTRTVANSVEAAGQVSLPTDWVWQNTDQALAEGTVTVAIAVYNGADKGNYVNEAVAVSITRLEAGIPFVTEINGEDVEIIENGWEHVSEDLAAAEEGDTVVVDMNGATVLPGNVIGQIKGKDITVVLEMDEDVSWSIHGETITAEEVADVDLGVELNTANIPVDVINKITGEIYTMQISLAHNGEFGYTAVLCINLDAENAGYYAQLFHYASANTLKFMKEDIIDEKGYAELPFTHASEYVIVIDDAAYKAPGSGSGSSTPTVTPAPVVTPAPAATPAPAVPTSPKTDDEAAGWMLLMAVAFVTVGLGSVYGRRKRSVK